METSDMKVKCMTRANALFQKTAFDRVVVELTTRNPFISIFRQGMVMQNLGRRSPFPQAVPDSPGLFPVQKWAKHLLNYFTYYLRAASIR
jgi:hypothetical protein